ALGLHPQVLGMTGLAFGTFVIFRVVVGGGTATTPHPNPPPQGGREHLPLLPEAGRDEGAPRASIVGKLLAGARLAVRRLALGLWVGVWVGGLALALAAVQLIPLAELGAA